MNSNVILDVILFLPCFKVQLTNFQKKCWTLPHFSPPTIFLPNFTELQATDPPGGPEPSALGATAGGGASGPPVALAQLGWFPKTG